MVAALATVAAIFTTVHLLTDEAGTGEDMMDVSFQLPDGGHLNISCEVADTHYERTEGLQDRQDLPEGGGMLFIFDEPDELTFIMPNMNFPLDIIFIAENGTVLNVEEAEPEEPGTPRQEYVRYQSDGEAKWVVEVNQGLSRQHGIGPGTRVVMGPSG